MTNTQTAGAPSPEERMNARGRVLGSLLENERWSNRQAGLRLGLSHRYIGDRVNGKVDITFSDVEAFAGLLKMPPNELFQKLLDLDSNQEPIGSKSALVSSLSGRTLKAPRKAVAEPRPVISLRVNG